MLTTKDTKYTKYKTGSQHCPKWIIPQMAPLPQILRTPAAALMDEISEQPKPAA